MVKQRLEVIGIAIVMMLTMCVPSVFAETENGGTTVYLNHKATKTIDYGDNVSFMGYSKGVFFSCDVSKSNGQKGYTKVASYPNGNGFVRSIDFSTMKVGTYLVEWVEVNTETVDGQEVMGTDVLSSGEMTVIVSGENHKHTFSKYTVVEKPTCVKTGKKVRECVCGVAESKSISKDASNHNTKHVKKAAGLLKNGCEYDYCKDCKKKLNYKKLKGYSKSYVKSFKTVAYKKGTKVFRVTWAKQSKANQKKFDGYEVRYYNDRNYSFKATYSKSSSVGYMTVPRAGKYTVKIRTFTKTKTDKFYSSWTKKTVTVK